MIDTILKTVVTSVIGVLFGYFLNVIKTYKKKLNEKENEEKMLKTALVTMLQSNLTNTYYVYENIKQIPDYVYKNWLNSLKIYEQLGGNDYIHILAEKMKAWDFIKTDILKDK